MSDFCHDSNAEYLVSYINSEGKPRRKRVWGTNKHEVEERLRKMGLNPEKCLIERIS